MNQFYFTPGPSQLYFTAEEHIKSALKENVPAISHRGKQFQSIFQDTTQAIRDLFSLSERYHVFFTSSATEIWERSIQNLVEFESCHFVNGAFSKRYASIAENLGRKTTVIQAREGEVVNIESLLIPESCELIAMTMNETSTGASHAIDDIRKVREGFPNQLLSLDVVSCAPCLDIDYSLVDLAYLSVQKCFGLPAGLGVWIVNDRCLNKSEALLNKGLSIGSYHALPELLIKAQKNQTPETPNVLGIYLLGKVAQDMLKKGVDMIRRETNYKAAALYNTFENSEILNPFVKYKVNRSKTTVVAETSIPNQVIIDKMSEKGLILGSGYGKFKDQHIRIANFPTHSKEQIEYLSDELMKIAGE
ncbi:alanine--glyoxylate aminotransferase family protein [Fulvivirga sp. M361]|uniref:aminotransferase class V-fold PLP-dependent enzyme n=1 Tax=Fulvivirga sp. M361 TaxID=2594266 RepID=UPI00117AC627|nr:aminotransferase class V-fold PLP-dependent enzyme [Fulvivirga sp. M361]TRX60707.1 alanine--glyoxylate aminotransferase family protein [Fulvivirga sp. M361]